MDLDCLRWRRWRRRGRRRTFRERIRDGRTIGEVIRQAEFVSPEMLRYHYDRLSAGYIEALKEASASGEIGKLDAEVAAYALMGLGEMIGMRWILWGDGTMPEHVERELARIVRAVLGTP